MKPIIGIVEWPYPDKDGDEIFEINKKVADKVIEHGGIPIGIFPSQSEDFLSKRFNEIPDMNDFERKDLYDALGICNAIIKPGATKIYKHEHEIYKYAFDKNVPYLGICGGMQIMRQHECEYKNNIAVSNHRSNEEYVHKIFIEDKTLLFDILKKNVIMVNSKHSYVVPDSGKKHIAARSEEGYIEALYSPLKDFNLGVQWHPELLNDENSDLIFERLVFEAKQKTLRR